MPGSKLCGAACLLVLLPVISAGLELEIEIVDGKGAPVQGLTASDLEVDLGKQETAIENLRYVEGLSETKIYVGAEMPANDFPLIEGAIRKMIDTLPADVEVSLGGAPFTSDKAKLHEYLANGIEMARKTPDAGMAKIWDFGQNYRVQGRPVLDNLTLLASQLAGVPGQKRVILYRQSLELRQDGLDTRDMNIRTGQIRQNDANMLGNEDAIEKLGAVAAVSRVRFYTANTSVNGSGMDDHGLNAVARHSGGKALLGGGNAYDVIEAGLGDLPGYYVATVNPMFEGKGVRRNIKASVNRKGVDLHLARTYIIDLPGLEALGVQNEDLLAKSPADATLPLETLQWVFRGPEGKPMILFAAGVPVAKLETSQGKKGVSVELSLIGGVKTGDTWTPAGQRRTAQVFEKKAFEKTQKSGDVTIDVAASGELPGPGMHHWKTVVRNSAGGAVGVIEKEVGVHDLSRPMSTSDVLLTRRAVPLGPGLAEEPWGDLLDFGGSRLIPESTREFHVGETVLFTYRLYNPPREMLEGAPEVQLALLADEVQLESFDGGGQSRVIEGKQEIQYVGSIETKGLAPGEYLILSAVPGREDERQPYVEGSFRLVKK